MKLEFSQHIFEKYSDTKFHENPSSGKLVVPFGRTDTHDEANSHFLKFCECAPKICGYLSRNWLQMTQDSDDTGLGS